VAPASFAAVRASSARRFLSAGSSTLVSSSAAMARPKNEGTSSPLVASPVRAMKSRRCKGLLLGGGRMGGGSR